MNTIFMSPLPVLNLVILDHTMHDIYKARIIEHNKMVLEDPHPNSGFDLLLPNDFDFQQFKSNFIDLQVKGCMTHDNQCVPFQIYARSSISKTPLMLANHVGIIDSGYRGNLIAAFRCLEESYVAEKNTRLVQICLPSLNPFLVNVIKEEDLNDTSRGSGGFGSTGV